MNAIAVGLMQSWHVRPIHVQSGKKREISVQFAIKPNLTAVRQVWAQTGVQAQTCALGSSAILSVPRNPQKELFRFVAILPQSRPRYLQSRWLRLDAVFLAILRQSVGLQGNSLDCTNAPSSDRLQQRGNTTISKQLQGNTETYWTTIHPDTM